MSHQAGRHADSGREPSARSLDRYTSELAVCLRERGRSRAEAQEIVGDVRRHLLHTGEEPERVYGPAREYAAYLVPDPMRTHSTRPGPPGLLRDVVWALTSGFGGFLVGSGLVDTAFGSTIFGIAGWVQLLAGTVLVGAGAVAVATGRLADPQEERRPRARLTHYALVAAGVAVATVIILVVLELVFG